MLHDKVQICSSPQHCLLPRTGTRRHRILQPQKLAVHFAGRVWNNLICAFIALFACHGSQVGRYYGSGPQGEKRPLSTACFFQKSCQGLGRSCQAFSCSRFLMPGRNYKTTRFCLPGEMKPQSRYCAAFLKLHFKIVYMTRLDLIGVAFSAATMYRFTLSCRDNKCDQTNDPVPLWSVCN